MNKIFHVDAFTNEAFKGNPAAVIPLKKWLSDDLMQQIALENNLPETVFIIKNKEGFDIRWFTPEVESNLSGHATLAAAHVVFTELNFKGNKIIFNSKNEQIQVSKNKDRYCINFPTAKLEKISIPLLLREAVNTRIYECYEANGEYLAIVKDEAALLAINPISSLINKLESYGVIFSAHGDSVDFVSRYFTPKFGVYEDPVSGIAHTLLIPFWAKELNKTKLEAVQLSKRSGSLTCAFLDDRIEMCGNAYTYLKGEINF